MSADRIAKAVGLALASTFVEQSLLPKIGLGFLQEKTTNDLGLPRGYGLVITMTTTIYFWVVLVGMKVGAARSKYSELATKDGEKEVAERYALPNLYAQGTSKNARAFNSVQRSHQQILETLPGFLISILITGLEFPVTAFGFALLWLVSRIVWVKGYQDSNGDAGKRYTHPFSGFFWHAMLTTLVTSFLVAIELLLGRKLFWNVEL